MNEQTRTSIGQTQQGQEEGSDAGGKPSPKGPASRGTKEKVELTQERLKELLHYDPETGIFRWRIYRNDKVRKGDVAGGLSGMGYIQITIFGIRRFAHRLAWFYFYGVWPKGDIDHINHDKLNNSIWNLRDGSTSENMENQVRAHSDNKAGVLGVCWHKASSAWVSQITIKGKKHHLGLFSDYDEAHQAYLTAKRKHHNFNII